MDEERDCMDFVFGYNGFGQLVEQDRDLTDVILTPKALNTEGKITSLSWTTKVSVTKNGAVTAQGIIPGSEASWNKSDDVFPGQKTKDVKCSSSHLVAVNEDGAILLWDNYHQQDSRPKPVHPLSAKQNNTEQDEHQEDRSNTNFTSVAIGERHCVACTDERQAWCMEFTKGSPLPAFQPLSLEGKVSSVSCGIDHCLVLTTDGNVYSFGLGSRGQLGHGATNEEREPQLVRALQGISMTLIACGGWHSVAVSEYGDLYSWGWDESGQLGVSSGHDETAKPACRTLPCLVDFPHDVTVVSVSCGSRHSAAVTVEGRLWTWGWGFYGQLGHGDRRNQDTPSCVNSLMDVKIQSVLCGSWQTICTGISTKPSSLIPKSDQHRDHK